MKRRVRAIRRLSKITGRKRKFTIMDILAQDKIKVTAIGT